MKLTGQACVEAMSGAWEVRGREGTENNAGGFRVERRVGIAEDHQGNFRGSS